MCKTEKSKTTPCGITVEAEEGIDVDVAIAAKPFTDWLARIDRDRFTVNSILIQSVDMFGPRVGFMKWKADLTDNQGNVIPGITFARGGSVAMGAVLKCEGKRYVAVTVQPRIATGSFEFVETAAGMLDGDGNFAGVAAKELNEELGIEVSKDELTDLTALSGNPEGIYLSPGGTDETMTFFAFCRDVDREELDDINGRLTGALEENEQITVKLVEFDDLLTIPDAKTMLMHGLITRFADQIPGFAD